MNPSHRIRRFGSVRCHRVSKFLSRNFFSKKNLRFFDRVFIKRLFFDPFASGHGRRRINFAYQVLSTEARGSGAAMGHDTGCDDKKVAKDSGERKWKTN